MMAEIPPHETSPMPGAGRTFLADGFAVHQRMVGSVVVLAVRSALDMLTAPALTRVIDDAVTKSPTALIVDLTEVDFLGSAGMSALITAHDRLGQSTPLVVVADGPATGRPLKMMNLDSFCGCTRPSMSR